jgi:hypothetical protein
MNLVVAAEQVADEEHHEQEDQSKGPDPGVDEHARTLPSCRPRCQ